MSWEDLKTPMLVSSIIFFLIALYSFAIRIWKNRARVGEYPFLYGLDSSKVRNNVQIKFELPFRDDIRLNILDDNESVIHNVSEGILDKGTHFYEFDASHLLNGIYYYQLTSTRQKSMKRFEKV